MDDVFLCQAALTQTLVRPHSSLGHRPPAPEAWLTTNMGHGEVETAPRFSLLHTSDGGYLNSEIAALQNASNGTTDRALQLVQELGQEGGASVHVADVPKRSVTM